MKTTEYVMNPVTLRMVPAPPRRWEKILNGIAKAVASMTAMQKWIKR